jgi:hypothetical protein
MWRGSVDNAEDCRRIGGVSVKGYFHVCSLTGGGRVAWIVRVVKPGVEGEGQCTDVMEIVRPADLGDIADLGLTLADAKLLLAGLQQAIVTGQARDHAARRPACSRCGEACQVQDSRERGVATLVGQVSQGDFRGFAAPRVAGSRLASAGRRTARRPLSWISFSASVRSHELSDGR